jgi:hypothetical protein
MVKGVEVFDALADEVAKVVFVSVVAKVFEWVKAQALQGELLVGEAVQIRPDFSYEDVSNVVSNVVDTQVQTSETAADKVMESA